jgi:hypothetical protein
LLRLLNERLVDPNALERDDRHRGRGDYPVEADRFRSQEDAHDQPLRQHQPLRGAGEEGVQRHAAHRAAAQLLAWEGEPIVAHREIIV